MFSQNNCLDPEVNGSSAIFSAKQTEDFQHESFLFWSTVGVPCFMVLRLISGCGAIRAPAATKIGVTKCL